MLAASVDAVLGVGAGAAVELVGARRGMGPARAPAAAGRASSHSRSRGWGRPRRPRAWSATALRNNRFLAAGLTALAALAAAVGGRGAGAARGAAAGGAARAARASPAARGRRGAARAARGRARRRGDLRAAQPDASARGPGARVGRCGRRPSRRRCCPLARRGRGARSASPIRWRRALLLAGVVYGGAAAIALARSWGDNLRFAPWTEIARRRRDRGGRRAAVPARRGDACRRARVRRPASPLRSGSRRSASRCPRRRSSPRARSPARAPPSSAPRWRPRRGQLDFDGDGFARALGGGDCDDRDPAGSPRRARHPGRRRRRRLRRRGRDGRAAAARAHGRAARRPSRRTSTCCWSPSTRCAPTTSAATDTRARRRPAIDALAAEGALFENGWAHAPSTRYSMPAIAAGRWPSAITWDESIWWPRLGPDGAHHRAGAARRRLLHGRPVQLQLLRARAITAASSAAWTSTTPNARRCTSP